MIGRYALLALLLAVLLIGACGSAVAHEPAATTVSTTVETTETLPTAVPTLPPTAPPEPTATPESTATPEPTATSEPTAVPEPTATPEPLNAPLAVPRGSVTTRPFAVMYDNHPNAYPQTGMDGAAIVFEALAEFGITRYMAVFIPGISPEMPVIGPVRSARPYYVEWAKGLRAVYVHAGGSPEGLLLAETAIELINMDALRGNASRYFYRTRDRSAPHNLYTNSANIAAFAAANERPVEGLAEIGFLYSAEAPVEERPAQQELRYFFIYREAAVGWSYDPTSNSYRYLRGKRPHIDAATGAQLQFKNVVILEVPERPIPNDPKGRIEQDVIGEGPARIFRDGRMIEATWRKSAGYAQLYLIDADGNEIPLAPGSVWIAAIPSLANLTVQGGR